MPATRYKLEPYPMARRAMVLGVVALAVAVWLATWGLSDFDGLRFMILLIALVVLPSLAEREVCIDKSADVVICEWRLFGRYLVYRCKDRLSDFTGIGIRRYQSVDDDDSVIVGLRRCTGKLLAIKYYSIGRGRRCYEAEQAGQNLSDTTGLPLNEDAV